VNYKKWFKYRKNIREADMKRKTQIEAVADILKKYYQRQHILARWGPLPLRKIDSWYPLPLAPLQVQRRKFLLRQFYTRFRHIELYQNCKTMIMIAIMILSRKMYRSATGDNVGPIACPHIVPDLYKRRFLDTFSRSWWFLHYGDSSLIGDSAYL